GVQLAQVHQDACLAAWVPDFVEQRLNFRAHIRHASRTARDCSSAGAYGLIDELATAGALRRLEHPPRSFARLPELPVTVMEADQGEPRARLADVVAGLLEQLDDRVDALRADHAVLEIVQLRLRDQHARLGERFELTLGDRLGLGDRLLRERRIARADV